MQRNRARGVALAGQRQGAQLRARVRAGARRSGSGQPQQTIYRNDWGDPSVEVHSVRTALRRDRAARSSTDLVIEVTQRRRGYFDPDEQESADRGPAFDPEQDGDFKYRAGCTILIDPTTERGPSRHPDARHHRGR